MGIAESALRPSLTGQSFCEMSSMISVIIKWSIPYTDLYMDFIPRSSDFYVVELLATTYNLTQHSHLCLEDSSSYPIAL